MASTERCNRLGCELPIGIDQRGLTAERVRGRVSLGLEGAQHRTGPVVQRFRADDGVSPGKRAYDRPCRGGDRSHPGDLHVEREFAGLAGRRHARGKPGTNQMTREGLYEAPRIVRPSDSRGPRASRWLRRGCPGVAARFIQDRAPDGRGWAGPVARDRNVADIRWSVLFDAGWPGRMRSRRRPTHRTARLSREDLDPTPRLSQNAKSTLMARRNRLAASLRWGIPGQHSDGRT